MTDQHSNGIDKEKNLWYRSIMIEEVLLQTELLLKGHLNRIDELLIDPKKLNVLKKLNSICKNKIDTGFYNNPIINREENRIDILIKDEESKHYIIKVTPGDYSQNKPNDPTKNTPKI